MKDLTAFQAENDDPRFYLRVPFLVGKYTARTNGHLFVAIIQAETDADTLTDQRPEVVRLITEKIAQAEQIEPSKWLLLRKISRDEFLCTKCKGVSSEKVNCEECDGSGEVDLSNDFNDYECICQSCDGAGTFACDFCSGKGVTKFDPAAQVQEANFDANYILLLQENFDDVCFYVDDKKQMAFLKFTHEGNVGYGALMSVRHAVSVKEVGCAPT